MTDSFNQGPPETAEDARLLLQEMDRDTPGAAAVTADCRPPLDVLETATAVEVVLDVPGVPQESLRVAIRRSTLLIVGSKPAGPPTDPIDARARFHVAERSFGRFARAIRLGRAFDASAARAVVEAGELRIRFPLLENRRGRVFTVPVERR